MSEQLKFGKTVCILLSGLAGTGKTTSANILKKLYCQLEYKADIFNFAHGVKSTAKFMGWDGQKDIKGRRLLQQIGASGREYDINCWVDRTLNRDIPNHPWYPLDVVIVDDWRFPNESKFIKETNSLYQVFEVRIYAPDRECLKGTPEYNDISETALPEMHKILSSRYDEFIENEGSMEELQCQCKEVMENINSQAVKW